MNLFLHKKEHAEFFLQKPVAKEEFEALFGLLNIAR